MDRCASGISPKDQSVRRPTTCTRSSQDQAFIDPKTAQSSLHQHVFVPQPRYSPGNPHAAESVARRGQASQHAERGPGRAEVGAPPSKRRCRLYEFRARRCAMARSTVGWSSESRRRGGRASCASRLARARRVPSRLLPLTTKLHLPRPTATPLSTRAFQLAPLGPRQPHPHRA